MDEIKNKVKDIDDLKKIVDEIEKDKSFSGLHNDIKKFKSEIIKELNKNWLNKLVKVKY